MPLVPVSENRVVRFRVRDVGPNPMPLAGAVDAFLLRIEYVSESGGQGFSLPDDWLMPYREALQEAKLTQAVHWVNLDDQPDLPVPERFMLAVRDGQIMESESD